jgi:hypothetical protein
LVMPIQVSVTTFPGVSITDTFQGEKRGQFTAHSGGVLALQLHTDDSR